VVEEHSCEVGAITRLMKQVSEADVALFELVTRDDQLAAEGSPRPSPRQPRRQAAPFALVAALMASAAARHVAGPAAACFERQDVSFTASAYTDDTLRAVAEVVAFDAAVQRLHVRVRCENQEGLALATGDFYLRAD